jgi:hypothetical protein
MKVIKWIFQLLLIALIIIQFFRPEKNKTEAPQPNDISNAYAIPGDVNQVLITACNDCHSNNTDYPWYSNIQPVAWWLDDHIRVGKKHLNFNEFLSYRLRKQYHKMEECIDMVKEKEMPLESYTIVHRDAKLTDEQRVAFVKWAGSVMDTMKARYPIDSLVKKN